MQIDTIKNIKFDKRIINYLSVIKPAATSILLSPTKTNLKDIIRYTMMDLAFKEVLSIKHKNIKLNPNDAYSRKRAIVETGGKFSNYQKSDYEKLFLSIIDTESYFQLHSYLSVIYKETPLDNRMKRKVLKENKILNLYSIAFAFDSFGVFKLNRNGKKIRNEIQRYFVTIEQNLEQIIEDSPEQALHLVSFLKGNFFLLKNISVEVLEKLNTLIRLHKTEIKDEYFNLFDIFEFSEIFINDISEEIIALLKGIERKHNRGKGSTDNVYDPIDVF
ncbi:hypothetical protein [Kordia sp.]|uniref:hypothetical protein n=1 Tax=Kordia sp. TaxID=1965332 RepID=UPI003D6A2F1C